MPDYGLTVAGLAGSLGVSRQSVNELLRERRAATGLATHRLGVNPYLASFEEVATGATIVLIIHTKGVAHAQDDKRHYRSTTRRFCKEVD